MEQSQNAREPAAPRALPPGGGARHRLPLGRYRRLAAKELREILRDRRTIVTLLVMPLLLYPLLGLACRQFVLARRGYDMIVGVMSEEERRFVQYYLDLGARQRGWFEERSAPEPLEGEPISAGPARTSPTQQPHTGERRPSGRFLVVICTDVDRAVRNYQVHVGLRFRDFAMPDPSLLRPVALDADLVVLEGSASSVQTAEFVEAAFQAANTRVLEERLRLLRVPQRAVPVQTRRTAVRDPEAGPPFSLVALAPLVLILMTITGAVYPAIDLTAGERERGTLEVLVAAPVPRMTLLLAKYLAVVVVACLTAAMNLVMMTATVVALGLGNLLFGEEGLRAVTVLEVSLLLLLFAAFFSAVLLAVASFAHSFKEAQAYLVPLMLVSIAPGLAGILPGLELRGGTAIIPLLNIVLLSRDLLEHRAELGAAVLVVASTMLYALAAVGVAARLFGAEAVLYSARTGWGDVFRPPAQPQQHGTPSASVLVLALLFPTHLLATQLLALWLPWSLGDKLVAAAAVTALIFGGVPLVAMRLGRVRLRSGLALHPPPWTAVAGAMLLGISLWTLAHEVVVWEQELGVFTLDQAARDRAAALVSLLGELPLWLVVLALGVTPAVFEEFCFRGYVYGSLAARLSPRAAVCVTALLFGAFHLVAAHGVAIERLLPSTLLGLVLGWLRLHSGSVWPGVLLHALHNGLLAAAAARVELLKEWGVGLESREHLPWTWLAAGLSAVLAGAALVMLRRRPAACDGER
ncbi:MAG: ABC transporter permease subunit [Pirellulales bacterium]|nr:ABC transporter permease subunit [Pirellulales bacterium]